MEPFHDDIQAIIDLIRNVKEEAKLRLSSYPDIANTIIGPLNQLDNRLCHRIGQPLSDQPAGKRKFGPISLGKKPEAPVPTSEKPVIKTARESFADDLKKERDAVWPTFASREPDEIVDSLQDPLIRAVARKAGIKVTETDPEVLNRTFVIKVQEKMRKDQQLKENIAKGAAKD